MPAYLILAYVVFCAVPLGLAIYLFVEQRHVDRLISDLEAGKEPDDID